jgi:hypothetical protein
MGEMIEQILSLIVGAVVAVVGGIGFGIYKLFSWLIGLITGKSRKRLEGEQVPPRRTVEARNVSVTDVDARPGSAAASVPKKPAYVHLDPGMGHTSAKITDVLSWYEDDPVVGPRASACIESLRELDHHKRSFHAELASTFDKSSISWQKFAGPADAACEAVLRNSALLGNRIQAFDSASYLQLDEMRRAGTLEGDAGRKMRMDLQEEKLARMTQLQESNDKMLLDLERLSFELSGISSGSETTESQALLEELETLVDQAKFYRS